VHLNAGHVNCLSFSPDGEKLATGDESRFVRIWNTSTWTQVNTLAGHGARVETVAYSPNGNLIASSDDKGSVILWEAESGVVRHRLSGNDRYARLVLFSPDGARLATVANTWPSFWKEGEGNIKFWDTTSGKQDQPHYRCDMPVEVLMYHPEGRYVVSGNRLISGDGHEIRCWDAAEHRERFVCRFASGHRSLFRAWALSPDGSFLLAACEDSIYYWRWRDLLGLTNEE
jgi:WD40 repeat protein